MATDYYRVLGVARDASEKEVRAAFRRLARRYHPDVNPGDSSSEERFKEINTAYEVLSDGDARKQYDRYGDNWRDADRIEEMRRQGGFGGSGFGAGGGGGMEFDLGELGRRGRGGSVFDMFRRATGRQRGADVEHTTRVTLEEAYRGTTRTIEVREGSEVCRICGGEGTLAGATCHACRGSGSAAPVRRIEVSIPPGIASGIRIRVAGKGAPGASGGAAGDLFLKVEVQPHSRFELRGDDLHIEIEVPVADAALGAEVQVPTLKGRNLALTVPAGTQGGRVFRLAGQGMPRQRGGYGDLHARVRLTLPHELTDEQRELFGRLRDSIAGGEQSDEGGVA